MQLAELPQTASADKGWTDARVDVLKALWADGLSASQIAAKLGEVTRNAVLGKVFRLGLPARATASRRAPVAKKPRILPGPRRTMPRRGAGSNGRQASPKRSAPAPLPPDAPLAGALMLPLDKLTEEACRWPFGDPKGPGFGFCGHEKAHGSPYCGHHAAAAGNGYGRRRARLRAAAKATSGAHAAGRE